MKPETAQKLLGLVKDNYQAIAADFDKTRRKEAWPELQRFTALAATGRKILDIGCGNGRLISTLNIKADDYLGIDNSDALLSIAKARYPEHHFLSGDILDLDKLGPELYDSVFCLAVWPHIPSSTLRIKALENMKERLSSGGTIVISAWNLWSSAWSGRHYRALILKSWWQSRIGRQDLDFGDILFPWKDARGTVISQRYYHAFRSGELARLASAAGLKIADFKKDKFNYWLILNKK
jgi:2-polyprenyl-3-methyl-5-hydroxy-6-metoxy-1,4-benzoquinol methylase